MAQQLGTFVSITKDLGLVSSNLLVAHSQLQFQGICYPPDFHGHRVRMWCAYVRVGSNYTHKLHKINLKTF